MTSAGNTPQSSLDLVFHFSDPRPAAWSESLVDIAQIQEFGGPPVIIPITPKMRRYLAVLLKRAGTPRSARSGRGVVVTQVPPRLFLRPAFEKFRTGVGQRLLQRLAAWLS